MDIRLQKYKKNRMLGMNKYNAAIAAGFSESTAKARGKDLDKRAKISDILERHGLTDKALVSKLSELLEASEFIFKKNINGKTEIIGDMDYYTPAWATRTKALELALKLKDLLRDKVEHLGEIKTGETRIVIIQPKEVNAGTNSRTETVPV